MTPVTTWERPARANPGPEGPPQGKVGELAGEHHHSSRDAEIDKPAVRGNPVDEPERREYSG